MGELHVIAELMAVAARTAPKTKGEDCLVMRIVDGQDLETLGQKMAEFGVRTGKKNFDRDGRNVANSDALLLVGIKDASTAGLNCGACGVEICELLPVNTVEGEFRGPNSAYRLLDLGIALGSAAKTAGMLNADSRIMYRAGADHARARHDRRRLRHGHPDFHDRQEHLLRPVGALRRARGLTRRPPRREGRRVVFRLWKVCAIIRGVINLRAPRCPGVAGETAAYGCQHPGVPQPPLFGEGEL